MSPSGSLQGGDGNSSDVPDSTSNCVRPAKQVGAVFVFVTLIEIVVMPDWPPWPSVARNVNESAPR